MGNKPPVRAHQRVRPRTSAHPRVRPRNAHPCPWSALVIPAAGTTALLIALQPLAFLVRHLKDDSYYYFKTANNIALGLGPTFDGLNQTNGFHPLWMLNLLPIYAALPHAPLLALRVIVVVLALYHTLTALLLFAVGRRVAGDVTGVGLALGWALCPFVLRISFSGMEAALYGLVLAGLLLVIVAKLKDADGRWALADAPLRTYVFAGLLAGLCVLARLDAVYVVAGLGATLGATLLRRGAVRAIAALVLPIGLLLAPYLLYNWLTFGHITPVSGLIKRPVIPTSLGELVSLLLWPLSPLTNRVGLPTVSAGLALLIALIVLAIARNALARQVLVPVLRRYDWLWIGAALLYAHISLSKTYIANWYYVPFALLLALALGEVAARSLGMLPRRFARRAAMIGALGLLVSYAALATVEFHPQKNQQVYETWRAAAWLKQHTPPEAVGGAWNAGVLGYFSERRVVNLDGLINSYEYYDALQQARANQFAIGQGVSYVFDVFPVTQPDTSAFMPAAQWAPYLEPIYERRFFARNVGISSLFKTVFPQPEQDAVFMFKVWRVGAQER